MAITIAQLETKFLANRSDWDAGKAAVSRDIDSLSRQFDALSAKSAAAFASRTGATSGATSNGLGQGPAQAATQYQQATQAAITFAQATKQAQDPIIAQAREIKTLESNIRAYSKVLGDSHPQTQRLRDGLVALQPASQQASTSTRNLSSYVQALTQHLTDSDAAASKFGRGVAQSLGGISLIAGGWAAAGAAVTQFGQIAVDQLGQAISKASQLELAVTNISTIKPEINVTGLEAQLGRLSTDVPRSAAELAQGYYQVASSIDLTTQKSFALTDKLSRGATASFTNFGHFTDAIVGEMNAFKLPLESVDHLMDLYQLTVNKGVLSGEQLASGLGQLASSAQRANQPIETLSGLIVGVTKGGGDAGQNLNNLNNLLSQWSTERAQTALSQLGIKTVDATGHFRNMVNVLPELKTKIDSLGGIGSAQATTELNKLFPDLQAQTGLVSALTQIDAVNDAVKDGTTKAGLWADAFDKVNATASSSAQRTLNQIDEQKRLIGNDLLPLSKELSPFVSAGSILAGEQIRKYIQGAGEIAGFVTNPFGLFGQSAADASKTTIQSVIDMRAGTAHAFSDIGDFSRKASADVKGVGTAAQEGAQTYTEAMAKMKAAMRDLRSPETRAADFREGERSVNEDAINQVANANRAANPRVFLPSQVVDATQQTALQTALDKAKAGSQAFIASQVAAQKAQKQLRDSLDLALKSAGLITETSAERELREQKLSAVEFVKSQAQAAYDIVTTGVDIVSKIQQVRTPSNLDAKIKEVANLEDRVIAGVQSIAKRFSTAQLAQMYAFSQAANSGMQFFAAGVSAFGELSKIKFPSTSDVDRVVNDGNRIIDKLGAAANRWKIEALVQLGLYADTGTKAAQFVQAGASALDSLREAPKTTIGAMDAFVTQFGQLTDRLRPLSTRYAPEVQQELADFGDDMAKALAGPQRAADLLKTLPEISGGVEFFVPPFFDNLDRFLVAFKGRSVQWRGLVDDETKQLSSDIKVELDGLVSAVDFTSKIKDNRTDVTGQIRLLFDNASTALTLFKAYAARWKNQASQDTVEVATSVGTVFENIGKTLDPIARFRDTFDIGDYEIDQAFANVEHSLDRFSHLSDLPALQGQSLARLQQASATLGSAFSGLKTAVDTILSLRALSDDTGTTDLSYSLDQFFLTQVPSYADAWAGAMGRIGSDAEGAGRRITSALGAKLPAIGNAAPPVPAAANALPNAMASGAVSASAGSGNTYNLNIGGQSVAADAYVQDLIRKILAHLNVVNGGVVVGGAG